MSWSLEIKVILDAMDMAMKKMGLDAEVIFHSDRGSQYAGDAYRKFLKSKGVKPSMSKRATCDNNTSVESWFSSLKKECSTLVAIQRLRSFEHWFLSTLRIGTTNRGSMSLLATLALRCI